MKRPAVAGEEDDEPELDEDPAHIASNGSSSLDGMQADVGKDQQGAGSIDRENGDGHDRHRRDRR